MNIDTNTTITFPTPELDKISLPNWLTTPYYTLLQQHEIDELIENHIWITADRIKIPVSQMSTSHIQNCIKCFNGQGKSYISPSYLGGKNKWLDVFNRELQKEFLYPCGRQKK